MTAGADFTCALAEDSLVVKVNPVPFPPTRIGGVFRRACWGHNLAGQLGFGPTSDSLWRATPTESSSETLYWTAISASPYNQFACGTGGVPKNVGTADVPRFVIPGELWCWGWNGDGELGIGAAGAFSPIGDPR